MMLCFPEKLKDEDERLFKGYLKNMTEYTHEEYLQKFASEEYLAWIRKARKHRQEALKEGRRP